ncbi:MAG: bifunctional glutamate N-acetyltransferase/amino-acid acetyltransferase ArgJ [Nitrospinales bacterium]
MKLKIKNSFTVPGFSLSGIACGIKNNKQKDLALLMSEVPANAAGVFTQNQVVAASVTYDQKIIESSGKVRAIIVNSGNANACTGKQGMKDCHSVAGEIGKTCGFNKNEVLIASTGVIGVALPTKNITSAIPKLTKELSPEGWGDVANAILTTDLVPKTASVSYKSGSKTIVIGGVAKGSGMIHPNMATMLAFLTTNISLPSKMLQRSLKKAVDLTFNKITVDGDTSTNDMTLCLANGLAENPPIKLNSKEFAAFEEALTLVCKDLAMKIVKDGEGATKFVTIQVHGAKTSIAAEQIAKTIANSKLVKTALFGADPNWGRIIAAVGNAGVPIQPEKINITLNKIPLIRSGSPVTGKFLSSLESSMKKKEILINVNLNMGEADSEVFTCDLSYDYIKINAEYTT